MFTFVFAIQEAFAIPGNNGLKGVETAEWQDGVAEVQRADEPPFDRAGQRSQVLPWLLLVGAAVASDGLPPGAGAERAGLPSLDEEEETGYHGRSLGEAGGIRRASCGGCRGRFADCPRDPARRLGSRGGSCIESSEPHLRYLAERRGGSIVGAAAEDHAGRQWEERRLAFVKVPWPVEGDIHRFGMYGVVGGTEACVLASGQDRPQWRVFKRSSWYDLGLWRD